MTQDNGGLRRLFGDLSGDLRLLLTQTVGLASAEARATASAYALTLGMLAAGALVALLGALVLIAALVLIVVALGLPPWAAASLVAALLVITGLLLVQIARAKLRTLRLDLHETRASLAETIQWLKTQVNR